MPKHISWRLLINKFRSFGFDGPFSGGKHLFVIKGQLKVHIPNPHTGDISVSLIIRILKQAGISKKEWDNSKN